MYVVPLKFSESRCEYGVLIVISAEGISEMALLYILFKETVSLNDRNVAFKSVCVFSLANLADWCKVAALTCSDHRIVNGSL